ncbi:hypothetical protein EP331_08195 [bacterium]|nr:MAG: hypothetical protein EP331_08195 [bacterium]
MEKKVTLKTIFIILLSISAISCSVSPKEELQKQKVPFTDVAFFDSVKSGNTEVVKLFIDAGMPVDIINKYEETPLMLAVKQNNLKMIDALLLRGASVFKVDDAGKSPFIMAARNGAIDVMDRLVQKGSDVNDRDRKYGFSALNYAVDSNKDSAVYWLIAKKVDVNLQSKDGGHPLIEASYNGNISIMKALLDAGSQVNLATQYGQTALHYAAMAGQSEAIKLLLSSGADKSLKDVDGKTAKQLAEENKNPESAALL